MFFHRCPTSRVSQCLSTTYYCTMYVSDCADCLSNTIGAEAAGIPCSAILVSNLVTARCAPCPDVVYEINRIVFATLVVGALSIVGCALVIIQIVAYSRDLHSMRDRIVIGLMLANALVSLLFFVNLSCLRGLMRDFLHVVQYSAGNAVPLNGLKTGTTDCGELALSFTSIRLGRCWWFGGK